ncbi:MAG: hypothetical protein ACF8MF_06040 [Phycisphaerales bacterium JB052]
MQISAEPKGWSDAEVDQIIADVESIEGIVATTDATTSIIAQHTANMNEYTYTTMHGHAMIVFVLSVLLGYWLAASYVPSPRDLGRWRGGGL